MFHGFRYYLQVQIAGAANRVSKKFHGFRVYGHDLQLPGISWIEESLSNAKERLRQLANVVIDMFVAGRKALPVEEGAWVN